MAQCTKPWRQYDGYWEMVDEWGNIWRCAAAREYIEKLGCFGGGFVAGYYGSNEAIGVDPELQAVACRAFMKYGDPAPKKRRG